MTANIPSHPGYKSYCRPVLFTSLSHFMLTMTWTDSKHGMFCNMKAFDFGRFEESYPLYHLVVFWGVIDSNILFNFPLQFGEISEHPQVLVT